MLCVTIGLDVAKKRLALNRELPMTVKRAPRNP
jgi:hypothetical protein